MPCFKKSLLATLQLQTHSWGGINITVRQSKTKIPIYKNNVRKITDYLFRSRPTEEENAKRIVPRVDDGVKVKGLDASE